MKRLILIIILFIYFSLSHLSFSQIIEPYTYKDMTSWDSSPYKSFIMKNSVVYPTYNMTFRLLLPLGYDSSALDNTQYPLAIMLHGGGESAYGNSQFPLAEAKYRNNDSQLAHGGQQHLNAVNSGKWPGFVLFPQNPNGYWIGSEWMLEQMVEIVKVLSQTLRIDPNRISINGLSAGGYGIWEVIARHPDLFASALPMSGIGIPLSDGSNTTKVAHLPIWYFQGGKDTAPRPSTANQTITALRNAGGTPVYTLYPENGHNTWDRAFSEPDFFPFMLRQSKLNIHVYHSKKEFCPGESFSVKLGVSPGFTAYEWKKDDIIIPEATGNEITVNQLGSYTVRFSRGSIWTAWSAPAILKIKDPTPVPVITAKGSTSLPSLDGSTSVVLSAPSGQASYKWSTGATTQNITVSSAGSYTVQVIEIGGCISSASVPILVTVGNGSNIPTAPGSLASTTVSPSAINLTWLDNSSNETGFEIYRALTSTGPYSFVKLTSPNSQAFSDISLAPNTTYYYKIRAINNDGGSAYTSAASATTSLDIVAPTIPQNLIATNVTQNSVSLSWNASTDNVGVTAYLIYKNNVYEGTTTSTSYMSSSLAAAQIYSFVVKAQDLSGNLSGQSNQVTIATVDKGLKYSYYEGSWDVLPNFSATTVVKSGVVDNFTLAPKNNPDYFAFKFDGFIHVPTSGEYTFYTSSDDGSKLYINSTEIVNNDGLHGVIEKSGTITLSAGSYPITVGYIDKTGGETLEVRYSGPGITKQLIPDTALVSAAITFVPPAAPGTLIATAATSNQINLTWSDNSSDETGFEIYRSVTANAWSLVGTAAAGSISFSDNNLIANTTYSYKVRAISNLGVSAYSNESIATTLVSINTPAAPSALVATAASSSKINLKWNDNASNETGFEIHRSTSSTGTYTIIYTSSANVTSYSDSTLPVYTQYFYKIRAINASAYSPFTGVVNARTFTNAPLLIPIGNKNITEGLSSTFTLSATDPDSDALTFSATGLPPFASIKNLGGNSATLTFAPGAGTKGVYNGIVLKTSDGKGGVATETISINVTRVNKVPVLSPITDQNIMVNSSLTINLSATDPEGDVISLSVFGLPAFATLKDNHNGTGTITFNPKKGNYGTYSLTAIATDVNNGSAWQSFTLKVEDVNFTIPVLAAIGNITVTENSTQTYIISATDADLDSLSLTASGLPNFATFAITRNGVGVLTISPEYFQAGEYPNITFTVSDGKGGIDAEVISITVTALNRPPVLAHIPDQILSEGALLSVEVSASDPDGDIINLSAANVPGGFSAFIDKGNGLGSLNLSPGFAHAGVYTNVTIIAVDGKGDSTSITFKVTVNEVTSKPQTDNGFKGKNIKIQPNPITYPEEKFALIFDSPKTEPVHVELVDLRGRVILSRDYKLSNEVSIEIDLSRLIMPQGLYLIKVNSKTIRNQGLKMLKE